MTDAQINIFVLEALGWTPDQHFGDSTHWHKGTDLLRECPDYCRDLNLMHEAETTLGVETGSRTHTRRKYLSFLEDITDGEEAFATARQRAEAFVCVHGGLNLLTASHS